MNNLSIEELKSARVTYKVKRDLVAVAIIDELIATRELKGDQVPVGFAVMDENHDWHIDFCGKEHALSHGDSLFTAPQKPVVLPVVPHDFVLRTGGKQIHFGVNARTGESLWHSRYDGSGLWCGNWYDRTLHELESECISTLAAIKVAIEAAGGKVAE